MSLKRRASRACVAAPKGALDGRKRERRAALCMRGKLAPRYLSSAALIGARDTHALTLVCQVREQVATLAHPRTARLGQLAARLHAGDEAFSEPIRLQRRGLDRRSALGALGLERKPCLQAALAENVPARQRRRDSSSR